MLKQKFLVHFGSNIIIKVFTLAGGIVVARIAGPDVVGTIAYGTAYVSLWAFITGLFGSGHIKLVSEGQDKVKCMAVYGRLLAGSVALYFFVVLGVFLFQKFVLKVTFDSKVQQIVILLLLIANVFGAFYHYSSTTFTATMEQARANLPHLLRSISWQIGRIVVVLLGFKAVGLATWNLVITILFLPLVYHLIRKYPPGKWDKVLFKKYVHYAIPILMIVVINSIIQHADRLVLAHFTTITELGYYSAAYSIGGVILMVSGSIGDIFFPLFSTLLATNNWAEVKNKILKYQEFLSLFIFPAVCLVVVISSPLILLVLGSQYEPSILPFMILSLATYIVIVGMPYGNILTGMGRFYLTVWINVIKLAVFAVSITLFLSPRFLGMGATGLALHLVVINALTNYLFLFFAKRLSGQSFFSSANFFRYLLVIVVSLAFYQFRTTFGEWSTLWWIIIIPVHFLSVYLIMFMTGLMQKSHLLQLAELINLKKLKGYIKNDLSNNKNNDR